MNVGIVGLGLIGGSMAKAIKQNTSHTVYGMDISAEVVLNAKQIGAIDEALSEATLPLCDMLILALYPEDTVAYVSENAVKIRPGALVVDCCGVKGYVCENIAPIAKQNAFVFIGGHPMAGIEKSGFAHSTETLFSGGSMILTPEPDTGAAAVAKVKQFFLALGFGAIKLTTPEQHDRTIAYTSQLAHVLSSAYIKSPAAQFHHGMSAGSFRDMTRVATLNENMWTQLFLLNHTHLTEEIDALAQRLLEYSAALKAQDGETLKALLREGCACKAASSQGQ